MKIKLVPKGTAKKGFRLTPKKPKPSKKYGKYA